jgi:hypothetical protein
MMLYPRAVDPHDVAAYSRCAQLHKFRNFPVFCSSANAEIIAALKKNFSISVPISKEPLTSKQRTNQSSEFEWW